MKRKMRRLFAFLLALVILAPMGVPVGAETARAGTGPRAVSEPWAQVAILDELVSDGSGHLLNFNIKQDERTYPSSKASLAEVTFIFSYDISAVIPLSFEDERPVSINDEDDNSAPFKVDPAVADDFEAIGVTWKVSGSRAVAGVTLKSKEAAGISFPELKQVFSFYYKFTDDVPNGKQGVFRIEKDAQIVGEFFPGENSHRAGIRYKYSPTGRSAFDSIDGLADSIILTEFSYPGHVGTESSNMETLNLWSPNGMGSIRNFDEVYVLTAKNRDGVRVPFTENDSVDWDLVCTDPAVEKARLADPKKSVALIGTEKGTRSFRVKSTAEVYHRSSSYERPWPNNTYYNIYNVTATVNGMSETRQFLLWKDSYDTLILDSCTVTGKGMVPYTYYFPAEVEGGPTELVSQGLAVIPLPATNEKRDYLFTFKFRNVLGEEAIPEGNDQFLIKKFANEFGNTSGADYAHIGGNTLKLPQRGIIKWVNTEMGIGALSEGKANILTLSFTEANGQMTSCGYTLNLQAQKYFGHTGEKDGADYRQKYSWKMNFYITDILYTWPEALTNDPLTPLAMKPDQTYQQLLDDLVSRGTDDNPFFSKEAADVLDTNEKYTGEVTVLTPEGKPTPGQDNYVTFRFTVTDDKNGGKYKGKYVDFPRLVKIATLPTENTDVVITKVNGNTYDNQSIIAPVTKTQLRNANSLQDLGFPSSVTLSWPLETLANSQTLTGSELKFDHTLAELKRLSVDSTREVHLLAPAENIRFLNSLNVSVKVLRTGLGGGAGTVTLPGGGSYPYTGSPITPLPSVTVGGVTLAKDRDYTVEYKDNVNAGTGKIFITGRGDYSGTIETDFTISKAPLPGVIVDGAVLITAKNEYIAKVGDVLTPKFENGLAPNAADWGWKEKDTDAQVSNKRVYVPKAADAGKKIYVEAKAKPDTNYSGSSTSLPVQIVLPISGSVYIRTAPSSGGGGTSAPIGSGTELTAVITPDYPETVKWDYQWKKDGQVIPGEEGPTYILPGGITDNSKITVDVKPKDDSPVTGSLKSEDEITVGKKPLEVEKVEVSVTPSGGGGGPKPGDKLVASVTPTGGGGGTTENPPYKFVWMKDGEPVPDEEGPEYTLKPEDKGKEITVAVVPKEDDGDYTGTVPTETAPIQVPSTKPSAPENVTVVTNPGDHEITVKWDPPADDGGKPIEEYKVVVTDGEDKPVAEVPVDHDKTQCVIPGLKDDEEYKVKVIAVNGDGESDPVAPSGPDNPDDPDDPDDPDKPDKPDGPDDPDDPKPTPKPGSGGGWIFFPTNPTPKPSPSASPSESPSPVPTTSPDPSGPPKPTPDISPSPLPSSDPWPSACPRDDTCPIAPFPDANPKEWYHDGLHFCTGKNLMNGYANGLLGPNDRMTRAQLAMILYNMEKRPDNSGVSGFPDVPSTAWCAKAVTWAVTNRVMRGYSNGLFGPDDPVTREQLVAALYRYADSPPAQGSLERFTDWEEVSPYAKEGMIWAVSKDLVRGMGNNRLSPRSTSTRAQVGTIIYRYCKLISYRDA